MQNIHVSQYVFWAAIGIIVGAISGGSGLLESTTVLLIGSLFLAGCLALSPSMRRSVLITVAGLSMLAAHVYAEDYRENVSHDALVGTALVDAQATVIRVPRQTENYLLIEARLDAIDDGAIGVLLRGAKYDHVFLGHQISLTCTLVHAEMIEDFNYPMYLRMRGIHYLCEDAHYEIQGRDTHLGTRLADFRARAEEGIARLIRAPEAGLASGLLFGGDDHLSEDVQTAFARTGMSHITAVSGYNVTVISMVVVLAGIRAGLWRSQATLLAIVCVILFVIMIGFPASGVRAAIMGILAMLVVFYGRITSAWQTVVVACAAMLLWNPLQILYDVGFQLSFLAVCGILAFMPALEMYLIRGQRTLTILETLTLTCAAQIFVVPVIVYHFGTFSTASLLANVLVLPVLPFTMMLVFAATVCYFTVPGLALIPALLAQITLTYELWIIDFFALQSWSTVPVAWGSALLWMLYYTGWIVIAYFFYRRSRYTS